MAVARLAAESLASARGAVRDEIGDPATDFEGNAKTAGSLRYSDTQIDRCINDQLIEMSTIMNGVHPGEGLITSAELSYPAGDHQSLSLTATIGNGAVYRVVVIQGQRWREVHYVSPAEIENYRGAATLLEQVRGRKYTLQTNDSGDTLLLIRPDPSEGLTIRVSYIAEPLVVEDDADEHPLCSRWREHVAVGAAVRLLSRDDECPSQLMMRDDRLRSDFRRFSTRRRGRQRIRIARRAR